MATAAPCTTLAAGPGIPTDGWDDAAGPSRTDALHHVNRSTPPTGTHPASFSSTV